MLARLPSSVIYIFGRSSQKYIFQANKVILEMGLSPFRPYQLRGLCPLTPALVKHRNEKGPLGLISFAGLTPARASLKFILI